MARNKIKGATRCRKRGERRFSDSQDKGGEYGKQDGIVGRARYKDGKRSLHLATRESLVTFKRVISGERGRGHIAVNKREWEARKQSQ